MTAAMQKLVNLVIVDAGVSEDPTFCTDPTPFLVVRTASGEEVTLHVMSDGFGSKPGAIAGLANL